MKSPTKSHAGTGSPAAHTTSLSSVSYVSLQNFKKVTKRDPSTFDTFRDECYYDAFHQGFAAPASAQGLADICDAKYKLKASDIMRKSSSRNNKTLSIQFFSRSLLQTMAKHLSKNMKLIGMPSLFLLSPISFTLLLNFLEVKM